MGIQVQICGLILLLTVLSLRIMQRGTDHASHRFYDIFLACGILCLFLDGYSIIVIAEAEGNYGFYVRFICKAYLVILNAVCCLSFIYISNELEQHINYIGIVRKAGYALCAVMEIVTCLLPIYVGEAEAGFFTYGPSTLAVYATCVGFVIANLVILFLYKKYMSGRRWLAGIMWVAIWLLAAAIQFTHSDLLLVGYAISVGLTIAFIQLETPDYQKLQDTLEQLEISRLEADNANEAKAVFLHRCLMK